MSHTRIEPRPRPEPRSAVPLDWPITSRMALSPIAPPVKDFAEVLEARRSERRLQRPPLAQVVRAVCFATRSRYVRDTQSAPRYRRPSPSAGALHPFSVVIVTTVGKLRVWLVDADSPALLQLTPRQPLLLRGLRDHTSQLAPAARGFIIALVGNNAVLEAHYSDHTSLFWRDAGALTQTLLLSFEAFGLQSCALGISGTEIIGALGLGEDAKTGGIIVVGS